MSCVCVGVKSYREKSQGDECGRTECIKKETERPFDKTTHKMAAQWSSDRWQMNQEKELKKNRQRRETKPNERLTGRFTATDSTFFSTSCLKSSSCWRCWQQSTELLQLKCECVARGAVCVRCETAALTHRQYRSHTHRSSSLYRKRRKQKAWLHPTLDGVGPKNEQKGANRLEKRKQRQQNLRKRSKKKETIVAQQTPSWGREGKEEKEGSMSHAKLCAREMTIRRIN